MSSTKKRATAAPAAERTAGRAAERPAGRNGARGDAERKATPAATVAISSRGKGRNARIAGALLRAAREMMADLGIESTEVSVLLCGDREIAPLNERYRAKSGPTDVLAFALREGEFAALAGNALGDVVISVETAARQARAHGHALEVEVLTLFAHGLLHLLGWDHPTAAQERRMQREVARLLAVAANGLRGKPDATGPRRRAPSARARTAGRTPSVRVHGGRRPYTRT